MLQYTDLSTFVALGFFIVICIIVNGSFYTFNKSHFFYIDSVEQFEMHFNYKANVV